ncbi:MAG: Lrp/AsnC family transcriptional regulator [Chloroflexota bacterium]|nr:Lrp/AsnC family transcriptional regulator [Chloroflexota bacterium]
MLDDIDLQIIDLLITDGRMSSTDIAKHISGVTERTVRNRLAALIDQKIIQISAIPDPEAIGLTVIADVFIEAEPGRVIEIAEKLVAFDNISYVACSTGEMDISIQIVATSNAELYDFVTNVLGKIEGVRKTTTSIVPLILKRFGYQTRSVVGQARTKIPNGR